MKTILQTPRLLLREFLVSDAGDFHRLSLTPDVLSYTGDPPFESAEKAAEFLKDYYQYKRYGFGRWAVILQETDQFIGWCGFRHSDLMGQTDLGVRLFEPHWKKGYATEACRACLGHGFEKLALDRIVGRVLKDHAPSLRLVEKLGMRFVKATEFESREGRLYEMLRPKR